MMMKTWMSLALVMGVLTLAGCGGSPTTGGTGAKDRKDKDATAKVNDHSGWWCAEHGIPEHDCSMCSQTVKKGLKPEDLCPKHPDRSKEQCFICNPDQWKKYVAIYKAKYGEGKEPPEPEDNLPGGEPVK